MHKRSSFVAKQIELPWTGSEQVTAKIATKGIGALIAEQELLYRFVDRMLAHNPSNRQAYSICLATE